MTALPEYYFRIRDNGALVFRIDTENRQSRIEMEPIATINTNNGQIRPQGDRTLTEGERTVIEDWLKARQDTIARRSRDEIARAVEHLNLTTQWAQSRATPEELEEVTDALLLAMHDLRSTLVRKRAKRLIRPEG